MKLGIVIILIGIAWCVRCYLLRPRVEVATSTELQHVVVKDNVFVRRGEFPDDPKLIIDYEYHRPQEGETVEWIYWSAPDEPLVIGNYTYPGGTKHSHARRMFRFADGEWAEAERYPHEPREEVLP